MALSAAERAKRYRNKLKENPDKAEEVRRKQLARMKAKRKKVSEMSEEEKISHRNKWKQEKIKQRANTSKKTAPINETPNKEVTKITLALKRRRIFRNLSKQLQEKQDKIVLLKRQINTQRKRCYRMQQKCNEKIEKQQNIINKYKAREEFLEFTMKKTYENCEKRIEKEILKRIITNCKTGSKTYVARLLGLQRTTRAKQKKVRFRCSVEIETFWLREDVSRPTAGKKECRVRGKEKRQIRYTVDTLQNLYKKYKELGGKYGITTLWKYKPFYVIYPKLSSRDTCLCIKHANIHLKYKALQLYGPLKEKSMDEIINNITCDRQSYSCAANLCSQCKNYKVQYNESCHDDKQNATWWQWECVDHEYVKKEGTETKTIKTKKTVKALKRTSIEELKREFDLAVIKFKKHVFVMKHQHHQYQTIVNDLQENEAVVICDFSENYQCKMREEVQALHFGASQNQVCLHTGAIFYKDYMQSFCTISDNTSHRPENIWTHLNPILNEIKSNNHNVKILHFYSDGPTSQYRQKGNFHLLNTLPKEKGFEYCTWSFSESGHGKSIADGIGGSVKRTIDKHVAYGVDATNASQIYHLLTQCFKTTKFFLVDDSYIEDYTEKLQNLKPLPGTLNVHQIITLKGNWSNEIKYRDLSCYCGALKGQCLCFSPRFHSLINNTRVHQPTNLHSIRRYRPKESKNYRASKPESYSTKNLPFEKTIYPNNVEEVIHQQKQTSISCMNMEGVVDCGTPKQLALSENDDTNSITFPTENLKTPSPTPENLKTPSPIIEFIDLTQSVQSTVSQQSVVCLETFYLDDPILSNTNLENEKENIEKGKSITGEELDEENEIKIPLKRKLEERRDNLTRQAKFLRNNKPKHSERGLKCSACDSQSNQIAKCIICKLWYCPKCSGSQIAIDLICDNCLNNYVGP